MAATWSKSHLRHNKHDLALAGIRRHRFRGASLGFDYGFRLGPGRLRLAFAAIIGLTPLSSAAGALGAEIDYP